MDTREFKRYRNKRHKHSSKVTIKGRCKFCKLIYPIEDLFISPIDPKGWKICKNCGGKERYEAIQDLCDV